MQLPNELILRVIDHVHPADIEALALCNKTIRALAKDALERHEQLKRKYDIITLGNINEWQWTIHHRPCYLYDERALSLVADIFSDKDIAYYPVKLSLGPHNFDDPRNRLARLSQDDVVKYQVLVSRVLLHWDDFISGCSLLHREEKGEWHKVLQSSDSKSAAMALLLILLPNIRHLTLKASWSFSTWPTRIWTIADRIAQTDETTALSKLTRVTMDFHEIESGDDSIQAFAAFAVLPSMRWLDGVNVRGGRGWHNNSSFTWPGGSGKCSSKVKKVTFTRSSVHANILSSFLSGFAALQEFVYHHLAGLDRTYYQLHEYVILLQRYAGKTLVKLDITANRYAIYGTPVRDHLYVDLRGFSALKCIRVDDDLFEVPESYINKRDDGNRMARLVDVLPKSIVTLEILQHRHTAEATYLFKDLAELKEERLPELREICCWAPREIFDSRLTGFLKESLERVGIRTSITPFSTTDI